MQNYKRKQNQDFTLLQIFEFAYLIFAYVNSRAAARDQCVWLNNEWFRISLIFDEEISVLTGCLSFE